MDLSTDWISLTWSVAVIIVVGQLVRLFTAVASPAAAAISSPAPACTTTRKQGGEMALSQFAEHSLLLLQLQRHPRLKALPEHVVALIYEMAGVYVVTSRQRVNEVHQVTNGDAIYLEYSLPTMPPAHQVRPTFMPIRLRVTATSRDQGWSSYPLEQGMRTSHTWGMLRLLPPDGDAELACVEAYRNIHAGDEWEEQTRELDLSSEMLQELRECVIARRQPTHRLQLRLSAMYPGWVNRVRGARIEVVWALEGSENLHH